MRKYLLILAGALIGAAGLSASPAQSPAIPTPEALKPAAAARRAPAPQVEPVPVGQTTPDTSHYTATTHRIWVPGLRRFAHFTPRPNMKRRDLRMPRGIWPAARLPCGYTDLNNAIIPIDGNDTLGDCGPAMAAHVDNTLTFRATGKASVVSDLKAFESQYLQVSGGDNGTDESMMTGQVWAAPGGIAGVTPAGAVLQDHLDLPFDQATLQSAIANFGFVCMAFNVPNRWINSFDPNTRVTWDGGVVGNPMAGHYVALVGCNADGSFVLDTWGGSVNVTWAGLNSPGVNPEFFAGWTDRMFDPKTGLAFDGQTFDAKAALYKSVGGTPPPNPFPQPTPTPTPTPTPQPVPVPVPPAPQPTPTPTPQPVSVGFSGSLMYTNGIVTQIQPGTSVQVPPNSVIVIDWGNHQVTTGSQ